MKNSKIICFGALLFCAAVSVGAFTPSFAISVHAEEYAHTVSDDFKTTKVGESNVFKYENIVNTANASHPGLVGPSWGASIPVGNNTVGYFEYKIAADTGKVLSDVMLSYSAQIAHLSKVHLVNSKVNVYVSEDGTNWGTAVDTQGTVQAGGFRDFQVDLSNKLKGLMVGYVKIEEHIDDTYQQDFSSGSISLAYCPIKMSSIKFEYNDEIKTFDKVISDDFKTTKVGNSNVFKYENIVNSASTAHPGLVGPSWGASIPVGDNTVGYFEYKVSADSGKQLDELVLDYNAQISKISIDALKESKVSVYVSEDGTNWGDAVHVQGVESNAGTYVDHNVNLSSYVKDKTSIYVKVEEHIDDNYRNHSAFSSGSIPLSSCPIKMASIKLSYNQVAASQPTTHEYSVEDYWGGSGTQGTSIPNSKIWNADSVVNLGGDGNADWGAVVGAWGGTITVADNTCAEITYKIGKEGEVITSGKFVGEFKFWNGNSDVLHAGDRIFVDASTDNKNWERLEHVSHTTGEGITKTYNDTAALSFETNLASYIENVGKTQFIFVKVTLMHYLAHSAELGAWGMFAHQTGVEYKTKNCLTITYDVDGGTLPAGTQTCFFSTDSVYTLPTPTREGYEFKGWKSGETPVTTFDPSKGENLSVKADWELISTTHVISYYNTKDATNPNPLVYDETSVKIINLQPLSVTGYEFLGWFDTAEGGNKIESINPQGSTTDIDLYAHWNENTYTLDVRGDEHVTITCVEHESLPTQIKYTEQFEYEIACDEGYEIKNVYVNDALQSEDFINDGNRFVLRGSDCKNFKVVVSSVTSGKTYKDEVEFDFTNVKNGDNSWKGLVYEQSHLRTISDNAASTGLSLVGGNEGVIVLKFDGNNDLVYEAVTISGSARLFDFNAGVAGYDTVLKIYYSEDGSSYSLLKEYRAKNITSGDEVVNLAASKTFSKELSNVYIKVELQGANGMDWAVLRSLGIEFDTYSALDEIKAAAKTDLTNYAKNVDYAIKTQVDKIVSDAKIAIDDATSAEAVAGIVSIAKGQIDVLVLEQAKTKAKADIDAHVFGWDSKLESTIRPIINSGKTAIDEATSVDAVDIAYAFTIAELDGVKAQYEKEKALQEAKVKGQAAIDSYANSIDMSKYSEENKKVIQDLVASAKYEMDNITSPESADRIVEQLKADVAKVAVKKGGCGGSIGAASIVVSLLALSGVALVSKKRKEK